MKKEVEDTIIVEIDEELKELPHFYPVDPTGLGAGATSALRHKYFKHKIRMVVVENMLLWEAFDASDASYEPLYDSLKSSTTVTLIQTANMPAKLPREYWKEGISTLKAAYAEEDIYVGADKLAELTALKSRNGVIAEIVALLQSPMKSAASALQSGADTIRGVLKTLGRRPE